MFFAVEALVKMTILSPKVNLSFKIIVFNFFYDNW